jgi:hypothetical protein
MAIMILNQKRYSLSLIRIAILLLILLGLNVDHLPAQCLSSVNPIGGSNNLLVLEKNSLRVITFYRHNYGNQFFEGDKRSDFDLIKNANYNYAGTIIGYGLADKVTIETELGYFFNKTQHYNLTPEYTLRGNGFSNAIISAKLGLYKDNTRRLFLSSSVGAKIPFSNTPVSRDGVELPVEVQPTIGAFGLVVQSFLVKEKPATGVRYFVTNRIDLNARNKQEYKLGTSVQTSVFFSKHLMSSWLKGDWTFIMQVRNEHRARDKTIAGWKESSGSTIFYLAPQLNHFIKEKWNVSIIFDLPLYQHFKGTQLATKYGFSLTFARDLNLLKP